MKKITKRILSVLLVVAMLIPTGAMTVTSGAAEYYSDTSEWTLKGAAYYDSSNEYYVLTPDKTWTNGSMWLCNEITSDFTITFDYYSGNKTNGADGLAVVFYNDDNSTSGNGEAMMYSGLKGYAVELDTYYNSEPTKENHISINTSQKNHLAWALLPESEDDQWHNLKIVVINNICNVYVDGNFKISYETKANGYGYFGITSATGSCRNLHAVKNIEIKTGLDIAYNDLVLSIDTDEDEIPDIWEIYGADTNGDGEIDLKLNEMGADPNVPDIFVEVDWMVCSYDITFIFWKIPAERNLKPSTKAMRMVYEVFKEHGINLHIDCGPDSTDFVTGKKWGELSGGNEIPYVEDFSLGNNNSNWISTVEANFDTSRRQVFRHCMFAYQYNGTTSSGIANGIPGQYFIVANQKWVYQGGDVSVAGTFMHELGHTLGLRHGGCDNEHYKPNYLSIMNYAFQTTGLAGTGEINYSDYELPDIDESNISEVNGIDPDGLTAGTGLKTKLFYKTTSQITTKKIASAQIDFNGNKTIDTDMYTLDLNPDGNVYDEPISVLKGGFNDWEHISYSGGNIGTASGKNNDETDLSIDINDEEVITEKTLEESLRTSTLSTAGTGYIEPVALTVVKDCENQNIYFDVINMGDEDATYTVNIKCDELFAEYNSDVFVSGSKEQIEKTRISIPVNSNVNVGEYTVYCSLSYPEKDVVELCYDISVYVPTESELEQMQNQLSEKENLIDSDILKEINNVLNQTVKNDDPVCSHLCHSENAFIQFIWKIISFIYRLCGKNQYCECGMAHW